MTNTITAPGEEPPPVCICGAALAEGQKLCRKCAARERWAKRQAARLRLKRRRNLSRRPPRDPHRTPIVGTAS
ncbi:hypothetical protein [Acrocarpospora catenulata]|uniref:hypothetical protein n=1 Tax=Acrocarpospora catenulata TaxID=2836182 RepID=UPI0020239F8C|nr:hypothetical protein [Acrocarpospora catenulata]